MEEFWRRILIIGLVIFLFLFVIFSKKEDPYLESFKPILTKILNTAGFHIHDGQLPIQIKKSHHRTYTMDKKKIFIVSEKSNGEKYNKDTLLFVILHEMAHILSPEEHHTKKFYEIEKRLQRSAIQLGYLKMEQLDKSYPCRN